MNIFKGFLDHFIPDEIKSDGHNKLLRKSRMLVRLIPVIFLLEVVSWLISYTVTNESHIMYPFVLVITLAVPVILKYTKRYYLAASILPIGGLIFIPLAMSLEGGLFSFPTTWLIIGPVVSVFFLGTKPGLVLSLLSIAEIGVFIELHQKNYTFPHYLESQNDFTFYGFGIISMVIFVSYLSYVHEQIRSKFEENLKKSQMKAVNAIKAKDSFWANISHEIRTPMNGILGMTNLILDSRLNKEQRELLEIIKDCGESLNIIINDVLDYSKIESGELSIEKHPFELSRCIESVMAIFKHMADQKNLTLSYSIDSDVPAGLLCDEYRIRQILVNLLGNAIKFTEHGGIKLLIEATNKKNVFKFNVVDSGIGIPEEKADRLFKPFSQVDDSTARRYGGSGLGLVISKKLSYLLGGDIGFISERNVGSTFWFTLTAMPVKIRRETESVEEPVTISPYITKHKDLKILIAEDNLINQRLLLTLIAKAGYQADSALNGVEVLEALDRKKYDLILMDIQMPEMDGISCTKRIMRKYKETEDRPIIVAVTANVLDEDKDRCFQAGMDDFMGKPINPNVLHAILDRYSKKVSDPKELDQVVDSKIEFSKPNISEESGEEVSQNNKVAQIHTKESEFQFIDDEAILTNFSEDMEIIRVIIDQFSMKSSVYLNEIQDSINTEDHVALEKTAHILKGTISNFFAKELNAKVITLEKMGKTEDMKGAEELLQELKLNITVLIEELYVLYEFGEDDKAA